MFSNVKLYIVHRYHPRDGTVQTLHRVEDEDYQFEWISEKLEGSAFFSNRKLAEKAAQEVEGHVLYVSEVSFKECSTCST